MGSHRVLPTWLGSECLEGVLDYCSLVDLVHLRDVCRWWRTICDRSLSTNEWNELVDTLPAAREAQASRHRTRMTYAAARDERCVACLGRFPNGSFHHHFGCFVHDSCLETSLVDVDSVPHVSWDEACRAAGMLGLPLPPLHRKPRTSFWKDRVCFLSATTSAWGSPPSWFIHHHDTLSGWTRLVATKLTQRRRRCDYDDDDSIDLDLGCRPASRRRLAAI